MAETGITLVTSAFPILFNVLLSESSQKRNFIIEHTLNPPESPLKNMTSIEKCSWKKVQKKKKIFCFVFFFSHDFPELRRGGGKALKKNCFSLYHIKLSTASLKQTIISTCHIFLSHKIWLKIFPESSFCCYFI